MITLKAIFKKINQKIKAYHFRIKIPKNANTII